MPYLFLFKYWQYAVIALLITALGVVTALYKERAHKIDEIQAKHQIESITARSEYQAKVRKIEQANYQGVINAINESTQRQQKLNIDIANANNANERLHETLNIMQHELPKASAQARADYTASISQLFGECSTEIVKVAQAADGHANDAKMMYDAWPTDR